MAKYLVMFKNGKFIKVNEISTCGDEYPREFYFDNILEMFLESEIKWIKKNPKWKEKRL